VSINYNKLAFKDSQKNLKKFFSHRYKRINKC